MLRTITKDMHKDIINECQSYIDNNIMSMDEKNAYYAELNKCKTWKKLINSGIFHNAIGKVVECEDDLVIVSEEY